jgi:hypothetical protein
MSTPWLHSPAKPAAQRRSSYLWRPMRFAAVLATVVVGLTSCGDASDTTQSDADADEPSSTSAGVEDSLASLPSEDELAAGLLTIDDVPTGWAEVPQDDSDDPLCGIRITKLLGLDADTLPTATVEYAEDPDTGPGIIEKVGFVPAGRGPEVLPALDRAIDGCQGDTTAEGFDVTIADLSFPSVGEDSTAYRLTLTDPESDQSVHMDLVYIVKGDLAVGVSAYDFFGDPTETLTTYAPKAIRHAVRALGTTPSP